MPAFGETGRAATVAAIFRDERYQAAAGRTGRSGTRRAGSRRGRGRRTRRRSRSSAGCAPTGGFRYEERPPLAARRATARRLRRAAPARLLPALRRDDGAHAAYARHPGAGRGRLHEREVGRHRGWSPTSTRTPGWRRGSTGTAGCRSTRRRGEASFSASYTLASDSADAVRALGHGTVPRRRLARTDDCRGAARRPPEERRSAGALAAVVPLALLARRGLVLAAREERAAPASRPHARPTAPAQARRGPSWSTCSGTRASRCRRRRRSRDSSRRAPCSWSRQRRVRGRITRARYGPPASAAAAARRDAHGSSAASSRVLREGLGATRLRGALVAALAAPCLTAQARCGDERGVRPLSGRSGAAARGHGRAGNGGAGAGKRLEPEKASIREALGIAYFRITRWEAAEAEFRKVIELSPVDAYAHYALGRSSREAGSRADEARRYLKLARFLEAGPTSCRTDRRSSRSSGSSRSASDRPVAAEAAARRAVERVAVLVAAASSSVAAYVSRISSSRSAIASTTSW